MNGYETYARFRSDVGTNFTEVTCAFGNVWFIFILYATYQSVLHSFCRQLAGKVDKSVYLFLVEFNKIKRGKSQYKQFILACED